MLNGISLLRKRGLFQKKDDPINKVLFSQILLIPLILVIISGFLIKSIQRGFVESDYLNHIITGFLGYFLAFFISYIPIDRLRKYLIPFYTFSFITLLLIYFYGISVSGSQRWLGLGFFSFQPSEVAKLSTILTLALVLDRKKIIGIKDLVLPILIVLPPWLLIFFQPDLGTSLVLIVLTFVMLYWSQMPIEWILLLVLCIVSAVLYFVSPILLIVWIPFIGYLAYRSSQKKIIFCF